jgi:hypothetical protein
VTGAAQTCRAAPVRERMPSLFLPHGLAETSARSSSPLLGSSRRTCCAVHCTCSLASNPAWRRTIVTGFDLDAAIQVHGALAVLVIAVVGQFDFSAN